MTLRSLVRVSALSLIVGVVCCSVGALGAAFFTGDPTAYATKPIHIAANLIEAIGSPFVLLGLVGAYASQVAGYGRGGPFAIVALTIAVLTLGFFLPLQSATILPFVVANAPSLLVSHPAGPDAFLPLVIVGALGWVAGTVTLGLPHLRHRVGSAWPGYLLLAGAGLEVASFPLGGAGLAGALASAASAILPFIAFAGLGARAWAATSVGGAKGAAADRAVGATSA